MISHLFPAAFELPVLYLVFAFLLGASLGSFLNVCIARLPEGESIVRPGSRCPSCQTPIAPFDNIPLVSYAILRGRCRTCAAPISWRYPGVELLTAILFVWVVAVLGLRPATGAALLLVSALVAVTFIDLDHQIIPDVISLPGIPLGLALSITGLGLVGWKASLWGILLGGGLLWVVAEGFYRLTGKDGMGGGDIKLLAMIGAFIGHLNVLVTLLAGSLTGAVIGSLHIFLHRGGDRNTMIPFGPFLAFGALIALLYGDRLMVWYLGLAGF